MDSNSVFRVAVLTTAALVLIGIRYFNNRKQQPNDVLPPLPLAIHQVYQVIFWVSLAGMLLPIGITLAIISGPAVHNKIYYVLAAEILFVFYLFFWRTKKKRPLLIITEQGILPRGHTLIPWQAIDSIDIEAKFVLSKLWWVNWFLRFGGNDVDSRGDEFLAIQFKPAYVAEHKLSKDSVSYFLYGLREAAPSTVTNWLQTYLRSYDPAYGNSSTPDDTVDT